LFYFALVGNTNDKGMIFIIGGEIIKKVIEAIIRLFVGLIIVWVLFKIVNIISRKLKVKFESKRKIDVTVVKFLIPLIEKSLKLFIVIGYIAFIGIETSSIAAAITSAGLAIGLALQGSLSNFAGGFVILITRPFKVGDYIETCNESGFVENIEIFYTTLVTIDNRVIKIPNGEVASSIIIDDNTKNTRRVNLTFWIGHNNNYQKVRDILKESVDKTNLRLPGSEDFINIVGYNEKGVEITLRVWCKTKDYWDLYFMLQENIKLRFDKEGIIMPYAKLDITTNKSV
jgi:small conductance mechanosensitive channel